MSQEDILKEEVQALKELVSVQKQTIELLKLQVQAKQPMYVPVVQPVTAPTYIYPDAAPTNPWTGMPYVGDLSRPPFTVTSCSSKFQLNTLEEMISRSNMCPSCWTVDNINQ